MSARVLVVGLDAAEPTLLERWSEEGRLPTIATLSRAGASWRLTNSLSTVPGAIWPEIGTGRSAGSAGHYFHPDQLHTGEGRLRPLTREDLRPERYYWSLASRAGRRVAVVDHPHMVPADGVNGVQVLQWGAHERVYPFAATLPGEHSRLLVRHGRYPAGACDGYRADARGFERLLADLHAGIARKRALLLDLLRAEGWDLFACTLTESHCAGHQLWHYLDPTHPDHDPRAPASLRDGIAAIYADLDATVGALIDAAGDGTSVVVASHGMGPAVGGFLLLWEVLVRLGMGSDDGRARTSGVRRLQYALKDLVPVDWVPFVQRVVRLAPLHRVLEQAGCPAFPLESPRTRAAMLPNNRVGAIRLNLEGREPHGRVAPGREANALVDELTSEILALEHPDRGERIVERVVTADEAFGTEHHPDLPDLLVVFRTDLGPLDACRSPRVGEVRMPVRNARIRRTGDHTAESRCWVRGAGIVAGRRVAFASVLDVAPTVLDLLDVPRPEDLDGRPLALGSHEAAPARASS
jgi:predicted AlkP superfamily phosphohydrolase/phosphomutase